jgi:anaphase-promoting complex subunit 2
VALLTEDGHEESSDYTSFLLTSEGEPETKNGYFSNDRSALESITKWTVAPLEIAPETAYIGDGQNSVSLLTDIYGTKDHFITAYRTMLADKLIKKKTFDCSKELKTLELLKIRFGEGALHSAEVMMRDVIESKRLDIAVKGHTLFSNDMKPPIDVKVLVVSKYFWPPERDIQFRIPEDIVSVLDKFGKIYHSLKAPRVLKWKREIGGVTLCLKIGKEKLDFDVTPLQASILLQFVENEEQTIEDLCSKLEISEEVLLQKINFWINEGVMRERRIGGKLFFCRNETLARPSVAAAEYEDDQEQIQEKTMNYLEPFILGMLTNFDSLSLERIHNMLKMFATDPPYDKSLVELSTFMTNLSLRDKVVLEGKAYRKKG